ncbi:APO protein 2, chloroplastic isoform X1 [Beta vulgaris subsp. vulgaris]|uniref:APO protein 2, chloroplastic isoform X1 n=2 Tax=Beta vulgaris subsp. vulgaris TaxID=3555 RepID=UPI002037521E|nr:APO protein 2, chloroplastic isoform X1 [Beta vulgaris subsp. vulgaris]XP_019105764.2 APO protein 2, chloroplastic isoform X1 [Beta vulgaris subsp. vulgaris]XP_019105765.2 APO protein 2, chloroplastic isoform X1 [Beta vulgaris subsp. vulgaris]XP_048501820.1 APO protein 2, chloroplastic isoform X1 [Beta vulgaris subsp. vulgaris]
MPLVILQPSSAMPVIGGTSSHQQAYCMHSSYLNGRGLVRCDNLPSVSYFRKSEFVKSNVLSDLGFVNHLKVCGNLCKFLLKYRSVLQTSSQNSPLVIKNDIPQNADLPKYYSKKEKKPFPIPIIELRRAARERLKNSRGQPRRPVPPPKNGLLVKSLIPVAYDVLNARILLINNLRKLMKVVIVHACKCCNEIHVGPVGHPFKSCRGAGASSRHGLHDWGSAMVEDILVPVDAYHLYDRLRKRIAHDERFSIPRIPAVVELCIQAGVNLPEYPAKRRRKAIIRIGKNEFIDADESDLPDPEAQSPTVPILSEIPESEIVPPSSAEEIVLLAEETLLAWERMRKGANKLMKMYPVRVCGYCPEVHVGSSGHKAQNCGAHKHQQRNGQHGWQRAVLDDLIPPRYVWHVSDINGPPMKRELRSFYGQAPIVVELCAQAGAEVPDQYKPTMRLDIGIPASIEEAEKVV